MRAFGHHAVAAHVTTVVVDRSAAALCIGVVGLGTNVAVATDVSTFVERLTTAASGVAAVVLVLQFAVAAHVLVAVIDFAVTTAVRRVLVDRGAAAGRVRAVRLVSDAVVRTAYVVGGIVRQCATAAGVVCHQGVDTAAAALAAPPVVNVAVTAAGVRTVRQWTNAVRLIAANHRAGRCTDHNAIRDKGIYPKMSLPHIKGGN